MENGFIVDELSNLIKIFSMCASVRTEGTITVVDVTHSSEIQAYFHFPDLTGKPPKLDIKLS